MSNHPIVHIEFATTDPKATGKFYADLFGWELHTDPQFDYLMFNAGTGPGGAFVKENEGEADALAEYKAGTQLVYVSTDDIDATLAKVESLGGKILVPKTEIPQNGWFGIFTDVAGNRVALYTASGRQS